MHNHQRNKQRMYYWGAPLKVGALFALLLLFVGLNSGLAHAAGQDVAVYVDGRRVLLEDPLEAKLDGNDVSLAEILIALGQGPVENITVEEFALPAIPDGPKETLTGVTMEVEGHRILLSGLEQSLAAKGRIGIWIGGTAGGINWRICVIIRWSAKSNLDVVVDGHDATVVEIPTATIDDGAGTIDDIDLLEALKLLGPDEVLADEVELFAVDAPTVILDISGVEARFTGNLLEIQGLEQHLAARTKIGLWITVENVRVCVILGWGAATNLDVSVDGRHVTVVGKPEAQLGEDPKVEDVDLYRVLALLGDEPVQAELEFFDPASLSSTLAISGVQAVVTGNRIDLTGLEQQLAGRTSIGIWISGSKWRVCIIIKWGERRNLEVFVDERRATIEGPPEAEINGKAVPLGQLLDLLGDQPEATGELEFFDPISPTLPLSIIGVQAVVTGSHINLTGLEQQLAGRTSIGIWISGSKWRICIIIKWGERRNLEVFVDERRVTVDDDPEAEIDGMPVPLGQLLALLGDQPEATGELEFFDPISPTIPLSISGVQAVVTGNRIDLTGLEQQLAGRTSIGIWISGSKWRVCIIIKWGDRRNLEASVDGRRATIEGAPEAEIGGKPVPLGQVLALLGEGSVKATSVELFLPAPLSGTLPSSGVEATIKDNHIALANMANTFAAHARIGIWIGGTAGGINWRICIIINRGSADNPPVLVDGRAVTAYVYGADLNGGPVDPLRVLRYLGATPVTGTVELDEDASAPLLLPAVQALVSQNQISLTGLSPELDARGRISIWISGSNWRICIIISRGVFTSSDNRLRVDVPALDAHTHLKFRYTPLGAALPEPLPAGKYLRHLFELDAENDDEQPVTQLDKPISMTVGIDGAVVAEVAAAEEVIEVAYYDTETGTWVVLPTTVNLAAGEVTAITDHLGTFVVWSNELPKIFLPTIRK
jgi:hypothetical protein